jgi:O-antigen/teichoic acid export membrane protein
LISVIYLFRKLKNEIANDFKKIDFKKIKAIAKRYDSFPKVNSFQALSDMFQVSGIVYFLIFFFNQSIVGIYSLTARVLQAPMNLIGSAIAQVFYQQASHMVHSGENLNLLVKQTIIRNFLIALPVLITLLLFGPSLFSFVFGEKWQSAGIYAQVLSPWIFLDFIRSPISQVPVILGKQKKLFLLSLTGNIILALVMTYGGLKKNVLYGFYLFSFLQCIWMLIIIAWIYKLSLEKNHSA